MKTRTPVRHAAGEPATTCWTLRQAALFLMRMPPTRQNRARLAELLRDIGRSDLARDITFNDPQFWDAFRWELGDRFRKLSYEEPS